MFFLSFSCGTLKDIPCSEKKAIKITKKAIKEKYKIKIHSTQRTFNVKFVGDSLWRVIGSPRKGFYGSAIYGEIRTNCEIKRVLLMP